MQLALAFLIDHLDASDVLPSTTRHADFQAQCMARVIDQIDFANCNPRLLNAMGLVSRGDTESAADVCRWRGTICDDGAVISMKWGTSAFVPYFCIHWVPPTVRDLYTSIMRIKGTFDARRLPRALVNLRVNQGSWAGELALQDLPCGLETFDVSRNLLSGVVRLDDLPRGIISLQCSNNAIDELWVDSSVLPESLEEVRFFDMPKNFLLVFADRVEDARIMHSVAKRKPSKPLAK